MNTKRNVFMLTDLEWGHKLQGKATRYPIFCSYTSILLLLMLMTAKYMLYSLILCGVVAAIAYRCVNKLRCSVI